MNVGKRDMADKNLEPIENLSEQDICMRYITPALEKARSMWGARRSAVGCRQYNQKEKQAEYMS